MFFVIILTDFDEMYVVSEDVNIISHVIRRYSIFYPIIVLFLVAGLFVRGQAPCLPRY